MKVVQRKTEEAAVATKRLKQLLESRKATARDNLGKYFLVEIFPHQLYPSNMFFFPYSLSLWTYND